MLSEVYDIIYLPCEFEGILEDRRKQFQQRSRGKYASDSAGRRMTRQPEITMKNENGVSRLR